MARRGRTADDVCGSSSTLAAVAADAVLQRVILRLWRRRRMFGLVPCEGGWAGLGRQGQHRGCGGDP